MRKKGDSKNVFASQRYFNATSGGFGVTFSDVIGPVIVMGHNFVNPRRADRSVTLWFGGFYQKIKADTDGHIPISSLFPDITPEQADEIRERLDEWVEGLPPAQEIIMREVIQKINDFFDGREPGNSEIHYVLDKRVAEPWNLIFGAQYQHNKNWQIRSEIGTFGKRTQFLLNLNYRFAGFRKR